MRYYGKSPKQAGRRKIERGKTMKDMFRKLQLFAEEGAQGADDAGASAADNQEGTQGDQDGQNDEGAEGADDGQAQEKKYTDQDVDRIIAKKIAAERKRMSKLFNEEQQENELEIRERNVAKREMMADAKDALVKDELPYTLAGLMDYTDKESYEASYKEVTQIFRDAVQQQVKHLLRGSTPKVSTGTGGLDPIGKAFARK